MFVLPVVSPFRLRVSHYLDRATFPAPATSNAACGFPALRSPVCFTSRVMGPVVPGRLSALASEPCSRCTAAEICTAIAYSASSALKSVNAHPGLTTAAAVTQTFNGWIRPAACAPSGYGERIEPLQASFARANESVTQASDIPHFAHAEDLPMRDFRDAKAMAQSLREALKTKSVSLTHSESLELVATILGFRDWNVLSATIQSEIKPAANPGSTTPATIRLAAENQLPIVPLRDIVVFPQLNVPLFFGRAKTIHAVECAMAKDR